MVVFNRIYRGHILIPQFPWRPLFYFLSQSYNPYWASHCTDDIRDHFGKPVNINSAYRTVTYNKKVDGATQSQHLYGMAADISISGVSPKTVAEYAETLLPKTGGIGIYQTFTHIDVRATKSRWNG